MGICIDGQVLGHAWYTIEVEELVTLYKQKGDRILE